MKIFYCKKCNMIDPNNIFDEICSFCGNAKTEDSSYHAVEHSDVDNLIIKQNIYNMIFGEK